MRKPVHRAAGLWKLFRRGRLCSDSRACGGLPAVLWLCLFFGVVLRMAAADERTGRQAVPRASVDPRLIRLPVIDGTVNRFARLSTTDGLSQRRVVVQFEFSIKPT